MENIEEQQNYQIDSEQSKNPLKKEGLEENSNHQINSEQLDNSLAKETTREEVSSPTGSEQAKGPLQQQSEEINLNYQIDTAEQTKEKRKKGIEQEQFNSQVDSNQSKTSLGKVGARLRASRQEKSFTTKELAESLKIGEEQLIALEQGREELLPERVFIKAMVRRVADKLNIDASSMLNEIKSPNLVSKSNSKKPNNINLLIYKISPKVIPAFIATISVLISIFAINYMMNRPTNSNKSTSTLSLAIESRNKEI